MAGPCTRVESIGMAQCRVRRPGAQDTDDGPATAGNVSEAPRRYLSAALAGAWRAAADCAAARSFFAAR